MLPSLRSLLPALLLASLTGCEAPRSFPHPEDGIARRSGFHAGPRPQALTFTWPDGIRSGQSLSEDQAIAIALWNNPDFQAALAGLGLARADVIKAGQLPNPALGMLFPNNASALEAAVKLPLDALWLRPLRVQAAQLDAQAIADNLTQGGLDVIRNVRVACAGIELARQRRLHAEESAAAFAGMAELAAARLKAGDTGELEPSQARAEAQVSRQEAQRLIYEEKLAGENLRALLGMSSGGAALSLRPLPPARTAAPASVNSLVATALASRPDIRAAELSVLAAGTRAKLAKAEILSLTVAAKSTSGAGTQPGLEGTLPLLNQNQAGRALADAGVEKSLRQFNLVRERAAAEVRSARVKLDAARSVSAGWETVIPSLLTAVETARRSVELGEANQLIALDATRRLAEARAKSAESEARLREARAELAHAIGTKLP